MKIPLLMIFTFVMVISKWATKALEDGKITAAEGLALIGELALILGVPLEIDVPNNLKLTTETAVYSKKDNAEADLLEASKKTSVDERPKII